MKADSPNNDRYEIWNKEESRLISQNIREYII